MHYISFYVQFAVTELLLQYRDSNVLEQALQPTIKAAIIEDLMNTFCPI